MNREQIYAALFAKLSASSAFKTKSRKLRHWADVKDIEQPALFQAQKRELAMTTPGQPTVWSLQVDVYIYVHQKNGMPSTLLNGLLDALADSLAPDPITNKCTLGGLVQHAWIEGAIETDEGTLGDQAVAIVPIVIKAV
ncbi:hypothetical protein EJD96_00070 (plasmid) [Herbaspirillum seropedicae]|uniref:hypothetical protein n=1 Tax=Herbaspirillum seropedicae TaxID=964 RepID=UPI00111DCDA7|nr:hypothetical protein [Herbaspirillum seropedicae]QDD62649.1 hypothetical protein EJD96_00070 [Herbaspirillum seropedicae]